MAKKNSAIASVGIDKEWQTRNDLDTLTRAHEIKKDPARMKAVKALAKSQLADLAKVAVGMDNDNDASKEPDADGDE